ncbi:hypothetical protein HETIRDRAFT_50365, partial [Heterobasidion irregulare TC 32-1]
TPYEFWTNSRVSDILYLRMFKYKAFVHISDNKHQKLNILATIVMFIGYEPNTKGYWFWNKTIHLVVVSHDVTFDKSFFPHKPLENI